MAQRFKTPITVEGAAAASSQAVAAKVDGDTQNRVQIDAGGKITWGDGSSAGDANLYRSAANAIKTDDTLEAAAGIITLTTSGAPTSSLSDGALAIDTTNDEFYIRSGGAWVKQGGGGATQSDAAPSNPVAGDLWYETDTGAMYIYYDSAWIEVGTAGVIAMSTTSTPPSSPSNGDLWFDIDTARTYVYYDDGTSTQWIEVGASSAAASGADGAIQFASGGTFSSDASNLYWDDTNNRLGIGTSSPAAKLDIQDTSGDYWTTSQWGDAVRIANESILRWGIGSTTVHGIGQSGDKLFFGRSTTEDSSSAATTYNMTIDSSGNVGVGTTSPSYKLHVTGGSSNDSTPEFAIDGNGSIAFHNGLGAGNYNGIVQAGDKGIIFTDGTQGTGEFVIAPWASGTGGMRIDSSGKTTFGNYVSQPRAFFRAYKGTTGWSLTGTQTIVFDNTAFNSGNNYSTSNGRFTAPVAGYYHLGAHFFKYTTYSNSTNTYWGIFTSNGYSTTTNHGTSGQDGGQSLSCIVYMGANDYADVQITSTGSTLQSYGTMSFNSFYGYLLSA